MKAIELIGWAMQMTEQGIVNLIADMHDAPMTRPTSAGGNHPMWVMGHLAYVEGSVAHVVLGEANPVEHWGKLFAPGTTPVGDESVYPKFEEVVRAFRELRGRNLRLLEELGEEGLGRRPKNVPAGFEEAMQTVGQTLLLIALHQMVHYGQVADARRVAGRRPLM